MSDQPTELPLWDVRGAKLSGLPARTVAAPTAAEACERYRKALALSAGAPLTAVPHAPPAPSQGE